MHFVQESAKIADIRDSQPHEEIPSIDWRELERGLTGFAAADPETVAKRGALLEKVVTDPTALTSWIIEHPQRFATAMGWCGASHEILNQLSRTYSQRQEEGLRDA